jgi:hypothetical protein
MKEQFLMTLTCKTNNNSAGKPIGMDANVYSGKIEDVGILNGITPDGWQQPIEVGVKLYLEQGSMKFQPELMVFGSVKRDEAGNVVDWGGAFPVRDVINQVGGYAGPIGENLELPQAALKQLIGKTVHYIRYKSNRAKDDGSYYNSTFKELGATEAAVIEKWKRSRSKGYPKDYYHAAGNGNGGATMQVATEQVF